MKVVTPNLGKNGWLWIPKVSMKHYDLSFEAAAVYWTGMLQAMRFRVTQRGLLSQFPKWTKHKVMKATKELESCGLAHLFSASIEEPNGALKMINSQWVFMMVPTSREVAEKEVRAFYEKERPGAKIRLGRQGLGGKTGNSEVRNTVGSCSSPRNTVPGTLNLNPNPNKIVPNKEKQNKPQDDPSGPGSVGTQIQTDEERQERTDTHPVSFASREEVRSDDGGKISAAEILDLLPGLDGLEHPGWARRKAAGTKVKVNRSNAHLLIGVDDTVLRAFLVREALQFLGTPNSKPWNLYAGPEWQPLFDFLLGGKRAPFGRIALTSALAVESAGEKTVTALARTSNEIRRDHPELVRGIPVARLYGLELLMFGILRAIDLAPRYHIPQTPFPASLLITTCAHEISAPLWPVDPHVVEKTMESWKGIFHRIRGQDFPAKHSDDYRLRNRLASAQVYLLYGDTFKFHQVAEKYLHSDNEFAREKNYHPNVLIAQLEREQFEREQFG